MDDSTGEGDDGEVNARGPWNEGGEWEIVETPAFQNVQELVGDDAEGTTKLKRLKGRSAKAGHKA